MASLALTKYKMLGNKKNVSDMEPVLRTHVGGARIESGVLTTFQSRWYGALGDEDGAGCVAQQCPELLP